MPRSKPTNKTRKQAKQTRSKRTVRAILGSAARILKRDGLAGLTTNHIALEANISVGSIYQYFPNKQAILLNLMTSQLEQAAMSRPTDLDKSHNLAEHIAIAVRWHLDIRRKDPLLFQRLFEVQRNVLTHAERSSFEKFHENAVNSALTRYQQDIRVQDLATASLVVSQFLLASTQSATAHNPDLVDNVAYEAEIVSAVMAYLT